MHLHLNASFHELSGLRVQAAAADWVVCFA